MNEKLITVAKYPTAFVAHAARGVLDAAGIPAIVVGDAVVTDLSYLGQAVGYVSLQVSAKDYPAALELLEEFDSAKPTGNDKQAASGHWTCPNCQAVVDEGFDTCWSCGAASDSALSGADEAHRELTDGPVEAPENLGEVASDEDDENETDRVLVRAWRAAIVGIVLCPPLLTLYSVWLLISASWMTAPRSQRAHRCRTWATAVNVVVVLGFATVILLTLFESV